MHIFKNLCVVLVPWRAEKWESVEHQVSNCYSSVNWGGGAFKPYLIIIIYYHSVLLKFMQRTHRLPGV